MEMTLKRGRGDRKGDRNGENGVSAGGNWDQDEVDIGGDKSRIGGADDEGGDGDGARKKEMES